MALALPLDAEPHYVGGDNQDGSLSLSQCQKLVGGLIERVCIPPPHGDTHELVCNEEGLILSLGLNVLATGLAGQPIVGPAILVKVDGERWL